MPIIPAALSTGPTNWAALNQAIRRIPGYRAGVATWTVTARYGHWGATDVASGQIYISPRVPAARLFAVAAHEYAHARIPRNWAGNWQAADAALARWFGGGPMVARERAADCMVKVTSPSSWTNYTSCGNAHWRQGALMLLAGKRLA